MLSKFVEIAPVVLGKVLKFYVNDNYSDRQRTHFDQKTHLRLGPGERKVICKTFQIMFLELLEKFLKNKETSWKYTKSQVKSAKVDILSTYLLKGHRNSK